MTQYLTKLNIVNQVTEKEGERVLQNRFDKKHGFIKSLENLRLTVDTVDIDKERVTRMSMKENQIVDERLMTLETEIKTLSRKTAIGMLEMGDKLIEARRLVPHGKWETWLENNVSMSLRTARNLMTISQVFSANRQAIADLGVTSLYLLAGIPDQERTEFLLSHDVRKMTIRELEDAIHGRNSVDILMQPLFTDEMRAFHKKVMEGNDVQAIKEWLDFLRELAQGVSEIVIDCEAKIGELILENKKN